MKNHWWPFKVGDRVRIRRCKIVDLIGMTGTIAKAKIYDIAVSYMVDIDGEGGFWFWDSHNRPLSVEHLHPQLQDGGRKRGIVCEG